MFCDFYTPILVHHSTYSAHAIMTNLIIKRDVIFPLVPGPQLCGFGRQDFAVQA